jgi:hypothetical protein
MKKLLLTSLFLILAGMSSGLAQNGGFAGASMRIGFGPRGLAMGNAMSAHTHQGVYGYYNPALSAALIDQKQFDLSVASMAFDRELQSVAAAFPLPPKAGLTVYLSRAGVDNIDGRTQSGFHTGFMSTNEYQLATSFGIRLSERVYGGFGLKINISDLDDELAAETNFGIDLGLLVRLTNHLNLGITVQDLISEFTYNSSGLFGQNQAQNITNQFPTRIKFAGAYQHEKWVFSSEYEIRVQNSTILEPELILIGGQPQVLDQESEITTSATLLRFGGAYEIHERVTLRSGYRFTDLGTSGSGSFSSGFSIHLPFDHLSPSVDYALVSEPYQVSIMHVFALRFNL